MPEIRDAAGGGQVHMTLQGATACGYDRTSSSQCAAEVGERVVQLYDHMEGAWFAYHIHVA